MSAPPGPPRTAEWLLRRVLRARDAVRGDLLEEFRQRAADPRAARKWYWRETISLLVQGTEYRRMLTLDNIRQDIRFGLRSFARTPLFCTIVVATLALGIGASTAIFSAVDGIVLKPLPFARSDRLLWMNEVTPEGRTMSVAWPTYLDWRVRLHSFERMAASRTSPVTWTGAQEAERLDGRRVTADFFRVLDVEPSIGRNFTEGDDRAGAPPVVIVTHEFWQRHLGGDPRALGRSLTLDARPFTVIGILPAGFRYLRDYDVFMAMGAFSGDSDLRDRGDHSGYYALGRLRPGIGLDAAVRELQAVETDLARQHADVMSGVGATAEPLAARLVTAVRPTLLVLLGAVGVLLLIACVNVVNLLIARGTARQHELAVRAALGGRRSRLVGQLLIENALLSAAGGGLGLLFASALLRLLIAFAPAGTPRLEDVRLDGTAILFALAATALCGVVFGAVPAVLGSSAGAQETLVRTRSAGSSSRTHRVRRILLVAEVALALVLLAGAGLMVRTLRSLMAADPGFRGDHLLTLHIKMPGERWTEARRRALVDDLTHRASSLPGVTAVSAASAIPIDGSDWNSIFIARDKPVPARRDLPSSAFTVVTPDYFETAGMHLMRGRSITATDTATSAPVIVINETLARTIWPGEDPLGRSLKQGWPETPGTWRRVVGVVQDVRFEGVTERVPLQVYLPFAQVPPREFFLVARTAIEPAAAADVLTRTVHGLDRDLPIYDVRTMDEVMAESIAQQRIAEVVLTIFAAVALLLAAIGLYGLMAQSVIERTHEIGVRMALGACPTDVLFLIVRHGLALAAAGAAIGLPGAALLSRSLSSLLFQIPPFDPATFAAVAGLLLATAALACLIPGWRAVRIPPTTALRAE